jgi:hypothetical protein
MNSSLSLRVTSNEGKIHNILQVGRILNNADVVQALGTLEQRFKQELSQMEHIIKSLRLTTERYKF